MKNLIVFDDIDEAVRIKKILGNSVILMGNCISYYEDKDTRDVILGYCSSNKFKISLETETKQPKAKIGERVWSVKDMVEKPPVGEAPSRLAVLGRYIIVPEIFDILENTKPGSGGEIQLTDALKELAKMQTILAYNFEGRRYDVGDKQGFLEATVEQALKKPELRDKFLAYLKDIVAKEG